MSINLDKFTKNGYEVYELWLNCMYWAHIENRECVTISFSPDKLRDWMLSLEDHHTDGKWNKSFKNGTPLESYNSQEEIRKVSLTEYQLAKILHNNISIADSDVWHK